MPLSAPFILQVLEVKPKASYKEGEREEMNAHPRKRPWTAESMVDWLEMEGPVDIVKRTIRGRLAPVSSISQ